MISTFLDTAAVASVLLRSPAPAECWERPNAPARFRVSGLAGHLARAVLNVERRPAEPVPTGRPPIDAVTYFVAGVGPAPDLDDAVPLRIREAGEREAAGGPDVLAEAFDAARARLAGRLPTMPLARPVGVFTHVLPLARPVGVFTHVLSLARPVSVFTPSVPAEAAEAVTDCLTRIAVARHGFLPVMRALARSERTTGPIAAFQRLPGAGVGSRPR